MPIKQDIDTARKEGYSDQEIVDFLHKTQPNLGVDSALKEGYSPREVIDYVSLETPAKPPVSWAESMREPGKRAVTNLVQGTAGLVKGAFQASPLNPNMASRAKATQDLGKSVIEMGARPVREAMGQPQPSENPKTFRPLPAEERPFAAISAGLFGAEPELVRERIAAGDQRGAMAARLAPPLLSAGVAGVTRAASPARIPNIPKSVDRLGKALGKSEASKRMLYSPEGGRPLETLFPRLAEGKVSPRTMEGVRAATEDFLLRSENEYNVAVQAHAPSRIDVATEMARRFRDKKKREVDPTSNAEEVSAFNNELEQAAIHEETGAPYSIQGMTLGDLDAARRLNFEKIKDPIAEALKERSDAVRTMDHVREEVYRDLIYDELGKRTGQGDYWRNLKRDQAIAIDLQSLLRQRLPDLEMNRITREPFRLQDLGTFYVQGGRAGARAYPMHILNRMRGADDMTPAKAGKLASKAFQRKSAFPIPRTTLGVGQVQSAGQAFPVLDSRTDKK